jgi:hypothetical protein
LAGDEGARQLLGEDGLKGEEELKGVEGLPGAAENQIKGDKGKVGEIYEGEAGLVGFAGIAELRGLRGETFSFFNFLLIGKSGHRTYCLTSYVIDYSGLRLIAICDAYSINDRSVVRRRRCTTDCR